MRETGIIVPIQVTLEPNLITDEGVYQMVTDDGVEFTVQLIKEGEVLKQGSGALRLKYIYGQVAGKHLQRSRPPSGGYTPYSFSTPFTCSIAYSNAPAVNDWYGQSALTVREYHPTEFLDGNLISKNYGSHFKNARLLSFNSDLLMLEESWTWEGPKQVGTAKLWKYDFSTGEYTLTKMFSGIPIFSVNPEISQTSPYDTPEGSPDWCVMDGYLYIAYRTYTYSTDTTSVVMFRTNDEELVVWEKVSETVIGGTLTTPFEDFRLRISAGLGVIMLVVSMLGSDSREMTSGSAIKSTVWQEDMRSFTSYDEGKTFQTKQTDFRALDIGDGGAISYVLSATSMAPLFYPENVATPTFKAKMSFDMYFDESMASFVILRAGGPDTSDNATYLMGIKTVDGDYNNWESCLRQPLDNSMTGLSNIKDGKWDPYEEGTDPSINNWEIGDLAVVSGETYNTVLLTGELYNPSPSTTNLYSTIVAQFTFAANDLIPNGIYDELYSYGGKYHEQYAFCSTVFSPEQNGLMSSGQAKTDAGRWAMPCLTRYRGQIVGTCKYKDTLQNQDFFKFLTVFNPWSNLKESHGYEVSYCRMSGAIAQPMGLVTFTNNGAQTFDDTDYWNKYTTVGTSASNYAYHRMTDIAAEVPSIVTRAADFDTYDFKVRFQLHFENLSGGNVTFLDVVFGDATASSSLKMSASSTGVITVTDSADNAIDTVSGFDWDNDYEILAGVTRFEDGDYGAWLFYRVIGEQQWQFGFKTSDAAGAGSTARFYIGLIEKDAAAGTALAEVWIGDVHISALGKGYRKSFTKSKYGSPTFIEGGGRYTGLTTGEGNVLHAPPISSFSSDIELMDGAIIRISGDPQDRLLETDWDYRRMLSVNSVRNVIGGVADNAYDFTRDYTEGVDLNESCVCYKTGLASDPVNEAEGQLIVFENTYLAPFNAFSLFNINGVHCFELVVGTYVAASDSWSHSEVVEYSVPRLTLDVTATAGNRLIASNVDDNFVQGQLKDYSILIYDTDARAYDGQLRVVDNIGDLIEVDQPVPSLTGKLLHLMYQSASYSAVVDPAEYLGDITHIGFRFFAPVAAGLKSIGQIVIGNYLDVTNMVSSVQRSEEAVDKIIDSKFGYSFMPRVAAGNVINRFKIDMDSMNPNNGEVVKMKSALLKTYKDKTPLVLVQQESDSENVTRFGYLSSPSSDPSRLRPKLSFDFVGQGWRPRSLTRLADSPPALRVAASTQGPPPDFSVDFTAVTSDLDGGVITLSWDWGDGTAAGSGLTPTHTYTDIGDYIVTVTATDETGLTTTRSLSMAVRNLPLDNFTLLVNGVAYDSASFTSTVTYPLTLECRDSNGVLMTYDNNTAIRLIGDEMEFDEDGDSSWDSAERLVQVSDGTYVVDFRCNETGPRVLTVQDVDGQTLQEFSITFV